jgi:glyoxylase-like metal-dependent hydrolase (beta-lactamase superfamily II)
MKIAEGVYRPEGLRASNAYVLVSEGHVALIDTGAGRGRGPIVAEIERLGHSLSELRSIMLTHAHSDHTGGVAELVRRSGAQVLAHREEAPYLQRTKSLPSGSILGRVMNWFDDRMSGGARPIVVGTPLDDGVVLDVLGGLRVIHTPGHTPGSICLYQEESGILFCGDLLFNGNPFTHRGGLQYAPRSFSADPRAAEHSAQQASSLMVRVLCMGHGEPIVKDAAVPMSKWLADVRA